MIKIKIISFLILLSIGLNSCTSSQSSPAGTEISQSEQIVKNVAPAEFNELITKPDGQLIDVRTSEEFDEGNIAKAKNIDFYNPDFQELLTKLDKNKPVYVYCRSGRRSGIALNMMKEMGFVAVYNLDGGIKSWQAQGLPIEKQ